MSHDEFEEWIAYYSLEPWGVEAEDSRWNTLYNLYWVANQFRGSIPAFLDRDPEETARIKAIETPEQRMERFFSALAARPAPEPVSDLLPPDLMTEADTPPNGPDDVPAA